MKRIALVILLILLASDSASAQAWTPPYCTGPNVALQYNARGWLCVTITGTQGPAGPAGPQGPPGASASVPAQPPPTQCITSNWDGTAWTCVPTEYLTAQ